MNGLIFDLDGVIGDTEPIIAEATIQVYRELYGIELALEDFHPYIGTGAVRYTVGPAEERGLDMDVERAVQMRHDNFIALLASGRDISFPGVHALIAAAAAAPGWRLALATSSPGEKSRATLRAARVAPERFDAYIHGDMITRKKPDPEIYQRAAGELGIAPAACIAVEDAVNGIEAGKRAGMKVLAVTNSFPREKLGEADLIIDSLETVDLARLEELLEQQGRSE